MDLTRYYEARNRLQSAAAGDLPLSDLDSTLLEIQWEAAEAGDRNTVDLVAPVLLVLAERDLGHRSDADVDAAIASQLAIQTLIEPRVVHCVTGSSARMYRSPITWVANRPAIGSPLVMGRA
jgi:hypothetical protein